MVVTAVFGLPGEIPGNQGQDYQADAGRIARRQQNKIEMARFYGAKGAAPREFTGFTVPVNFGRGAEDADGAAGDGWGDEDADWADGVAGGGGCGRGSS